MKKCHAIAAGIVAACASTAFAVDMAVVSHFPARHTLAPRNTSVLINFDKPVNPATFTSANVRIWGRWSGPIAGTFEFLNGDTTVRFNPSRPYTVGDPVHVVLSHGVGAADGSTLRAAGYSFSFLTRVRGGSMTWQNIATVSNRDGTGAQTRIYGASACDLDADGFMDLSTINEVSSDIRVFMNRDDGTGLFHPMSTPYYPISHESSPNEPGDFNNDGIPDLAAASYDESDVCVLMGNGDGTYQPAVCYDTALGCAGLTVLDCDGDGDLDLVSGNVIGNNCSLLKNNGNGTFAAAVNFEGGGNGEYQLAAADMNEDGIDDLVVGAINNGRVSILRGNGNGTFTLSDSKAAGGNVWAVAVGDLNGDGHIDVTTGNSSSANGSVLFGNGAGTLSAATVYPAAAHVVASDLGDLDNDGDLDWSLSCFNGGQWILFRNNGSGVFTQQQVFPAPSNPSCAIIVDIDNDADLDMVQTDEIADVLVFQRNVGTPPAPCAGDADGDGQRGLSDIAQIILHWSQQVQPGTLGDVSANATVGLDDIAIVVGGWGPCS